VKHILKRIFHMGIERLGHIGLGSQVVDGVRTTKFEAYEVVNFILTGLMRSDPIGPVYEGFYTLWHIPHSLGIARRANDLSVGGQDITRRQCWGWEERRGSGVSVSSNARQDEDQDGPHAT
jgi:hypothetical protein